LKPRDALLATLTSVIWGVAFVAVTFGLRAFSPPRLTAWRFLVACIAWAEDAAARSTARF
jgi:drug/metabolite transporter (DMT)-like permease